MISNILHRIFKKGKIYLHFTVGAITCYDNGANLFSHFKPFGNVKCQSSNVKSNPNFKYQKFWILFFSKGPYSIRQLPKVLFKTYPVLVGGPR